jgi:NitT/TauT family transport system substrate-binding protein
MKRSQKNVAYFCTGLLFLLGQVQAAETIRVGYFPNITHAQPLVGLANGTFQKALGDVTIDVKTFTAGPSAVEALFADAIDLAYMGPGPAINGYVKSNGDLVVIAGACSGGASLVIRGDLPIKDPADFHGKRVATPQIGGTQDIALRHWLQAHGLAPVEKGGDVQVLPMANADQLTLFIGKQLDAAWAPEPWATRLVVEGKGRIYLDERELWPNRRFTTTVIVVRKKYLELHPQIIEKWLAAHVDVTRWIKKNPDLARAMTNQEIKRLTSKSLPEEVITQAWDHLELTVDPLASSLTRNADAAFELGFLGRSAPDLRNLVDLTLLSKVLKSKSLPPISR